MALIEPFYTLTLPNVLEKRFFPSEEACKMSLSILFGVIIIPRGGVQEYFVVLPEWTGMLVAMTVLGHFRGVFVPFWRVLHFGLCGLVSGRLLCWHFLLFTFVLVFHSSFFVSLSFAGEDTVIPPKTTFFIWLEHDL